MKKKVVITFFIMVLLLFASAFVACNRTEVKIIFMVDNEVYYTVNITDPDSITLPETPQKDGYIFDGWYIDKDEWENPFTPSELLEYPIDSDLIVYAKFLSEEDVGRSDLVIQGFDIIEDVLLGEAYYASLPSTQLYFSFVDAVTVDKTSTWTLSTDIYGKDTIPSKTVNLSVGNNLFYILVENKYGIPKQHLVIVRRRPMYTVVYKTSEFEVGSIEFVEEGDYTEPPVPETTKEGYTFSGWSMDLTVPVFGDMTVMAVWTPNEYKINYDANGGEVSVLTQSVTFANNFSLQKPYRGGYIFDGWYYGDKEIIDGKWTFPEDITVVAHWSPDTYDINYNLSGGDNYFGNPSEYSTGADITLKDPSREGYSFVGWTTDNVSEPVKNIRIIPTDYGHKVFTAHWKSNVYTVTYYANGGNCSTSSAEYAYGNSYTLPVPTRDYYNFNGWYLEGKKVNDGEWNIAQDCTLVAEWKPIMYGITYSLNGGENNASNISSYTVEDEFTLQDPERNGYIFDGWTTDGVAKPVKNLEITLGSHGDKMFEAHWTAASYNVTFDANGGDCSVAQETFTFDREYTLPVSARVGYIFVGWYYETLKVESSVWQISEDCTLQAKWSARTDTPYIVNHYRENADDDDYTLFESENLTGISDSVITPHTKEYLGFDSPDIQWVTIAADGSLVVDYYYTRQIYTVTYVVNGGDEIDNLDVKYEAVLSIPDAGRRGYTFGGWFKDVLLTSSFTGLTMPLKDITLYAYWTEENKPGDFVYNGTTSITIIAYVGTSSTMAIPAYIGGVAVNTIGASAFENVEMITKVVVPDSVTRIGNGAFKGCSSIEDITLPFVGYDMNSEYSASVFGIIFGETTYESSGGIKQYEDSHFSYYYFIPKSIKRVTITRQTSIPSYAFRNCEFIEAITIPENTIKIGAYAFENCSSIEEITMSENATIIGQYAFRGCSSLKRINSQADGVYNLPAGLTAIEDYAFSGDTKLVEVTVGDAITKIGEYAFGGCSSLNKFNGTAVGVLIIPEGVVSIGGYAFENAEMITKVVVPDSVTSIGNGAFKGCSSIEDITLPFVGYDMNSEYSGSVFGIIFGETTYESSGGIKQYEDSNFSYYYFIPKSIKRVTITRQISIPPYAFCNCEFIETIILPKAVQTEGGIGEYAFENCNAQINYI